jgi:hypothetical protein
VASKPTPNVSQDRRIIIITDQIVHYINKDAAKIRNHLLPLFGNKNQKRREPSSQRSPVRRRRMRSKEMMHQVRCKLIFPGLIWGRIASRWILGRRVRGGLTRIPLVGRRGKLLAIIKVRFFFFIVSGHKRHPVGLLVPLIDLRGRRMERHIRRARGEWHAHSGSLTTKIVVSLPLTPC